MKSNASPISRNCRCDNYPNVYNPSQMPGNSAGEVGDSVYLINFVFTGGGTPCPQTHRRNLAEYLQSNRSL